MQKNHNHFVVRKRWISTFCTDSPQVQFHKQWGSNCCMQEWEEHTKFSNAIRASFPKRESSVSSKKQDWVSWNERCAIPWGGIGIREGLLPLKGGVTANYCKDIDKITEAFVVVSLLLHWRFSSVSRPGYLELNIFGCWRNILSTYLSFIPYGPTFHQSR